MVYCGKPSRGCQMCRTRRIKCDETKPTCFQCQKSRRQCPGYKDDFDLVFRNETQATEKLARRTVVKNKKFGGQMVVNTANTHQRRDSDDSMSGDSSTSYEMTISSAGSSSQFFIPSSLQIPIAETATNFFLSNFVMIPNSGTTRGYMDYLVPLIKSEPQGTHLDVAFNAAALAAVGNRPNGKGLLVSASEQYHKAIGLVNEALRDPVAQKSDQTLAAVLLLGLFETILARRAAVTAWGSHIQGAVMIAKMRGKKQLRTKVGHSLFIAVRTQMIVNCMAGSKPPELGTDWWITDAVKDKTSQVCTKLNLLTTELRHEVNRCMALMSRTPENTHKVLDLLKQAQEIEQGFLDWMDQLAEEWHFKTAAWVDNIPGDDLENSEVYPGKIDAYEDIWIASVWNNARVSRLFLSGIVVRCAAWVCSPVDYRTTPEYASAARLGVDMINDIIASIPFFLGWQGGHLTKSSYTSAFACGDDTAAGKGLNAYFVLWPLFSCSCSDFATDAQRSWIKGRMKYIKRAMGINQADALSYFQLRLPSMIIRRDGMGLQQAAGYMPMAGYPKNPLLSTPYIPASSPATSPTVFPTKARSISSSTSPPPATSTSPQQSNPSTQVSPSTSTKSSMKPPNNGRPPIDELTKRALDFTYPMSGSSQLVNMMKIEQEDLARKHEAALQREREEWEINRIQASLDARKRELALASAGESPELRRGMERFLAMSNVRM